MCFLFFSNRFHRYLQNSWEVKNFIHLWNKAKWNFVKTQRFLWKSFHKILCYFIKLLDKIIPTFVVFFTTWKKVSIIRRLFNKFFMSFWQNSSGSLLDFNRIKQKQLWDFLKFYKISWCITLILFIFDVFLQFWCISLNFAFAFYAVKSSTQNFGLKNLKF